MKVHKRCFTLLETLIATALTVIVLSALTYFYQQIDFLNNRSEVLQKDSFNLLNLENRLSRILPQAVKEGEKDFYFFTVNDPTGLFKQGSPKSLIFTYNNRVDIEKEMSNNTLGQLFLDPQGRLTLASWPSPERWEEGVPPLIKKEILLEGVDSLAFYFFIPPDKNWKPVKKGGPAKTTTAVVVKPSPEGGWVDDWSADYKLLPGLIRLEIKRKGAKETYVYPLSNTSRQIVYSQ